MISPKRTNGPKFKVIPNVQYSHWIAKMIWEEIMNNNYALSTISRESGVEERIVRRWRNGQFAPNIFCLEAILDVLGYELKVEKKRNVTEKIRENDPVCGQ